MAGVTETTIRGEWALYKDRVLPRDASGVQVRETQRAFYAGFWAMLCVNSAIGDPDVPEDDAVALLERLVAEARAFKRDVVEGRA